MFLVLSATLLRNCEAASKPRSNKNEISLKLVVTGLRASKNSFLKPCPSRLSTSELVKAKENISLRAKMFASRKLALHFQIFLLQFSVFDRCERVDKLEMLNYGIVNIHYGL